MNFDLIHFLIYFPVVLLSVALHEFAHCMTSDKLGDDTPRLQGRLTLNPLAHLDPVGTIMMVVSSLAGVGFGWGKSSPFNPMNFRHPARDRMISALAGPVSNILQLLAWASLGLVATSAFQADRHSIFVQMCLAGVLINAVLAGFNLIPIYPLDGHHVLSYLVPAEWRPILDNPMWGMAFLALVFIPALRQAVLDPVMDFAVKYGVLLSQYVVGWPG
ncbi:MAG: site-2 protease family protein [Armatimonadota bacterium]